MNEIAAYPLSWPVAWPRSKNRQRSRFNTSPADARDGLMLELDRLRARAIVISTNVELRRDGLPYANRRPVEDPGVAVYFRLNGEDRCIAVDRWDSVGDNMHAISLTIAALRGIDRWGSTGMVAAAFAGFAALPPGESSAPRPWRAVLEVAPDADRTTVDAAYRRLVKVWHPDVCGGDDSRFLQIQAAYEQAKIEVPA